VATLSVAPQVHEPPDRPVARIDSNSRIAHAELLEKARRGRIDVYFVGDSITRRLFPGVQQRTPADCFRCRFGSPARIIAPSRCGNIKRSRHMRRINSSDFRIATRGTSREINRQISLNLVRESSRFRARTSRG
jgi:hypothetical protein